MRTRHVAALTAALFALCTALGDAATPTFWQVSTQADFLKGQVENVSIDSDGRVVLGPATEIVSETTAPFLWTLMAGEDGQIWAGSGNEGQVFRIDREGKGTTFFDAAELEVHALAAGPDGSIYVGTSPEGRVYKVDRRGTATPFFDPDEKYIWALASAPDGDVYVATGDRGSVYRITPDGKGTLLYRTKSTHILSLAVDGAGNVLAGTESPGQILRIDRAGRAFVLLDSPYREIRALLLDQKGTVYAAAVSGQPPAEPRPPDRPVPDAPRQPPVPSVSTEITAITVGDVSVAPAVPSAPRRDERRASRGAVYRITPDGLWDVLWDSVDDLPYALALDSTGGLVLGTGSKGKIFRIAPSEPSRIALLTRAAAQQVTSFLRAGDGRLYYATANPGRVARLSSGQATRGVYESEIRDASTVATWGTIRWRTASPAGTGVELFSRTGNTAVPDETWSPWSARYTEAAGEQILSPNARYIQWRAVLTGRGESPVLTSVTTAYLPRNLRPEVVSITVHPAGTVFQKPFSTGELEIAGFDERASDGRPAAPAAASTPPAPGAATPALGRRAYQKGLQTFVWKADDGNEDRLQFDVLYRREGETTWKMLRQGLWEPIFVWDTTSVPDGTYVIKIAATDAPANSPGTALTGSLESTSFEIDNTPPQIDIGPVRRERGRGIVEFSIRDSQSPVQRVEYSLDANRWRPVFPKDGIPDSRTEKFELVLDGEEMARSVIVRATDALNNTATAVAEAQ